MTDLNHILIDRHFIGVSKPNRIGVSKDSSGDTSFLEVVRAWNASRQAEGKKGFCAPIHFLDRPVSGAMVFALSSKGASRLSQSFRDRKVDKLYLAIVHGKVANQEATLTDWLQKDQRTNRVSVCRETDEGAKLCKLSYLVLAQSGEFSLLKIKLHTGRSHQIRVQLSAIGHPIAGDGKYGSRLQVEGCIALHCRRLVVPHPTSKLPVEISAPIPDWWRDVSIPLFQVASGDYK